MQSEKFAKQYREKGVLKKVPLSDTVYFQYRQYEQGRANEGLVASGRFYPGTMVHQRFFSGITDGGRFLPGIVWGWQFIPGMVTRRGFTPGILTDSGFKPGVINGGIFTPGIVNGANLIPGVVHDNRFLPGCYTTDRRFAPGRLWDAKFESGVIDGKTFLRTGREKITAEVIRSLPREGYGMKSLRRYEQAGGVPVRGMIYGMLSDDPWYLPNGFLTDKGAVLGGLRWGKYLLSADPEAILEAMGIHKDDELGLGDREAELLDEIEKWLGSMIPGGSNPFGMNGGDLGSAFGDAMDLLGQGTSDLVDAFNKRNKDYWDSKLNNNTGGWITQDSGNGSKKNKLGWSIGDGATIGGIGGGLGSLLADGAITLAEGAFFGSIGGVLAILWLDAMTNGVGKTENAGGEGSSGNDPQKTDNGGGGNNRGTGGTGGGGQKTPDEYTGEDEGDPNTVSTGGATGPCLYPEVDGPRDRKIIQFVDTEEGKVLVIDRDALAKSAASAPQGTKIGVNMLTGTTIRVFLSPPTPEEIQKHATTEMFKKIVTDPIFHPNEDQLASTGNAG